MEGEMGKSREYTHNRELNLHKQRPRLPLD